jgi:putative tricarboxylic transport membrane protein
MLEIGLSVEILQSLYLGFSEILRIENLLFCFVGVFIGTLIGVLPGIGPVGTMSLLFPFMSKMSPLPAIIMLSGIYYGAQYGGSTTSILLNIPGEATTVVTCLDGYQMARKGRAGPALGIAAFGSFIAGTLGLLGLMLLAPPLASLAIRFGPPEYFATMCMGMTILIYLAAGSMIRALMMASFGVILGCIGMDPETGLGRFVFGNIYLLDGIGLAPFVMGLFGISEVFLNIEKKLEERHFVTRKVKGLLPNWQDWKDSTKPILRGGLLGFLLGILPGGGGVIATFSSYALEKKISKHPEKFGTGTIEGVAAPESANNSAAAGAFIPLLTLGIPPNVVMAVLLGALMIQGVAPGPRFIADHPDIFWGLLASMYVGNGMLLVLNLPLIGLWVQLLKVPYKVLFPLISLFCLIGAYSINNDPFDMAVMLIFGVLGYLLRKYRYEAAPMVLAFVLGPMFENSLRQSLLMSQGSFLIFFSRPIAAAGIIATILMLGGAVFPAIRRRKEAIPIE